MSIPQLNNPKKLSYNELRTQVSELARRMNILTEMRAVPVDYTAAAKFTFSGSGATLDVPRLDELIEQLEEAQTALEECETALEECQELLAECDAEQVACAETVTGLEGDIADLCSERPPAGSWAANQLVYTTITSGSCSGYSHYGQQFNTASLATNITFLGNAYGNGYAIINTSSTLTALYRIHTFTGDIFPPDPLQLQSDGSSSCMGLFGGIQIKKYDPSLGTYGSSQPGISAGATGIGTYGVFVLTNYNRVDPLNGTNPYQIASVTKETADDVFQYNFLAADPCEEDEVII
tara:strand:- start:113 stop:994 length:882 start_codon:yes stop_codon:yes gene_type:complete